MAAAQTAQGEVYSIERSPGTCCATTVILYPLRASTRAVVNPATPALKDQLGMLVYPMTTTEVILVEVIGMSSR
jgi:hypothetical protein